MHPVLFKIGGLTVYSYGAMVALGFGAAAYFISRRAHIYGLDRGGVVDMAIFMLIGGIVGARAFYVFQNFGYYISNPLETLNLSRGGLVWYGGFLSGLAALVWYARRSKFAIWDVVDLVAPYAALAQAIGRIGCFLNGCCYGPSSLSGFPFSVAFPSDHVLRHPTQIYSSLSLIAIFIILRFWQDRRHFKGEIFLGYCMLYSFKRFLIEFLRGDNARIFAGFTLSQCISAAILLIAVPYFIYKVIIWRKSYLSSR